MSLVIGLLGKILFVVTAGAGAVYAISSSSSNSIAPPSAIQISISNKETELENETPPVEKERFCPIKAQDNEKDCEEIILENY